MSKTYKENIMRPIVFEKQDLEKYQFCEEIDFNKGRYEIRYNHFTTGYLQITNRF